MAAHLDVFMCRCRPIKQRASLSLSVGLEEPHTQVVQRTLISIVLDDTHNSQVVHSLGRSVAQCLPRLSSQPSLPPPTPLPSFSDPPHPFPQHRGEHSAVDVLDTMASTGNKMRLPLLAR